MTDAFNPPGVIVPFGIFSNAAWQPAGLVLHVAGQVAWDEDGRIVGPGDVAAQTRQVLTNIKSILASVGGEMGDIVSVNVFVTEMSGLKQIHEVRAEFFARPYPASTLVQVAALVEPELLVEINAVAVIPETRAKPPA
jgi:2-iminobutanoate/2-iminopropanoate deaminase